MYLPLHRDEVDLSHSPKDAAMNLVDFLERGVQSWSGEEFPFSVDLRRHEAAFADAAALLPDPQWASTSSGKSLLGVLESRPEFASIFHKGQKLTFRLADDLVAGLGERLEAGQPAGLETTDLQAGRAWLVDFCDPNATKALHVGHLRNLILGNALAAVFSAAGARVARQSVVCDIGRNICEAMAGYLAFAAGTEVGTEKPDHFVGRWYTEYVRSVASPDAADAAPDAPIARELKRFDDLAEELLTRWRAGEPDARALWTRVRTWVLNGQAETLRRLDIGFDRLLFEAEAVEDVPSLIERGVARGLFRRDPDGSVAYPTGTADYPILPLLRADGFPTEHMRALSLWARLLQHSASENDGCIHVMGDEWVVTTIHRERILERLGGCPLFSVYRKVPYGMVTVGGSRMKSSTGEAVLIDDLLDRLLEEPRVREWGALLSGAQNNTVVRTVLTGFFLSRPASRAMEFSWEALLDERQNPGWLLARAWVTAQLGTVDGAPDPAPDQPAYRFAVIQSQGLRRALQGALADFDPGRIQRYAAHLAGWYLAAPRAPRVSRVVETTFQATLASLGAFSVSAALSEPA